MSWHPWFGLVSVLVAVGCGDDPPPTPGARVTFDDLCDAKYDLPDGSYGDAPRPRVTIDGYLVAPKMFSLCSKTCSFDLVESLDEGARSIRYSVMLGTEPNRLEPLPEKFDPTDFKLHTKDDQIVGFGDEVRLTGQRLGTSKDDDCQLYKVDLIEKP
ncbi:MAG: hypothetical protein K0V04_05355 [Deltaproteobacteria bacterium]|nr:hypothetical protein [Deltaproteobacteria bacterium]